MAGRRPRLNRRSTRSIQLAASQRDLANLASFVWASAAMRAGRVRRLEGFEHLGENSLTFTPGYHRDNRPVANVELNPGTALALQLDELE